MSNDIEQTQSNQPGAVGSRDPSDSSKRKSNAALGKLMWPIVMAVTGLLLYGIFSSDSDTKAKKADGAELEQIRPVPRRAEVKFTPAVAAPLAQALPPLPAGSATVSGSFPPPASAPVVDTAKLEADRLAAEAEKMRARRASPMMVVSGTVHSSMP